MEENKVQTNAAEQPAKMSYEQLENIAHQLSEQAKQMYKKLQEANLNNMFQRLNYLFKVIENSNKFPEDFVNNCINEVVDMMTLPKEEEKDN